MFKNAGLHQRGRFWFLCDLCSASLLFQWDLTPQRSSSNPSYGLLVGCVCPTPFKLSNPKALQKYLMVVFIFNAVTTKSEQHLLLPARRKSAEWEVGIIAYCLRLQKAQSLCLLHWKSFKSCFEIPNTLRVIVGGSKSKLQLGVFYTALDTSYLLVPSQVSSEQLLLKNTSVLSSSVYVSCL